MTAPDPGGPGGTPPRGALAMPAQLLAAAEWFNDALITRMEQAGWPLLSRSQSLLFVKIDEGGTRPAELARRLGITRQSMQELLAKLRDHGLVTVDVDPDDGRATIVRLAPRAQLFGRDAAFISASIEAELEDRIGEPAVNGLRDALSRDWGDPPAARP